MTTYKFLRWIHSTRWMDESSRYIGEVLEWYRGDDAGDLKRSESNELVENLTCLNALEGKIWKSSQKVVTDEKSWKTWKSNQTIVMNEELVQNGVMDGKFVENFVMDAKIDPKLVMDLSIFKIGGWKNLQPINQTLLEEINDVVRNSKQRSIPYDRVLGSTHCEFGSAHEEIDVTS